MAATRALHELVVLYRGKLTGILADKVPEGKHMKEFAAETLTKTAEFERVQHTEKEIEQQRRIEGAKDMAEREYIGPKRIVIKPQGKENEAEARGKTLTGQKMASAIRELWQRQSEKQQTTLEKTKKIIRRKSLSLHMNLARYRTMRSSVSKVIPETILSSNGSKRQKAMWNFPVCMDFYASHRSHRR